MPKVDGSTDREQRFVAEYLRDGNATRAASAAGYSPKSAAKIGWELLHKTRIADAIERGRARLLKHAEVRAQDLIDRLTVIAMADLSDIVSWDGESGRIKPFDEIDTRPILEFSTNKTTTTTRDGSVIVNEHVKVKLQNPHPALKTLAELLGLAPKEGPGAGGAGGEMLVKAYSLEDMDKLNALPRPSE